MPVDLAFILASFATFLPPGYGAGPLWNKEGLMTYCRLRVGQRINFFLPVVEPKASSTADWVLYCCATPLAQVRELLYG